MPDVPLYIVGYSPRPSSDPAAPEPSNTEHYPLDTLFIKHTTHSVTS